MITGKEIKLKICGMRDRENILAVAKFKPDYMGFIFYPESPRFVGADFIVPPEMPHDVKRVGVFVNASVVEMLKARDRFELDCLQLHGGEGPETLKALKKSGVTVWKVFSVNDDFAFSETEAFEDVADLFLFDTKGKNFGGNAQPFDWAILESYNQHVPFMLSGGLNAGNVIHIPMLGHMNLHGVDINSGAESAPGVKDPERIEQIAALLKKN